LANAGGALSRIERARQRFSAGDIAGARHEGEAILSGARDDAERAAAHLLLAACRRKDGNMEAALTHARAAVGSTPRDPLAHYAIAELQEAAGDAKAALANVERALELNPRFVQAHQYLGILRGEAGDTAGSAAAFEQAVLLDPGHARSWNNLGSAQRTLGRLVDAERSFARALAARPDYPLAAANLAEVQRDLGEVERAESTLREALARAAGRTPYRPLPVLLAGLLRERGELDEAAKFYVQAIKAAPNESGGAWFNLGSVLGERGEPQRARDAYARAYGTNRNDLRGLIAKNLGLPMIYADAAALDAARTAFGAGIAALGDDLDATLAGLSEAQVQDGLRWTNFLLAYQGGDDRALQAGYAGFAARAVDSVAPQWRAPITRRTLAGRPVSVRRVRVGFASAFFHVGTCGRYFKSWITDLDRERFEVVVYHLFPGMDDVAKEIARRADRFREFGGSRARPSIVAPAIRGDDLDVLVYPELGMDVTSFALAALRLAPRQYAAWGHPVTTGHATIDAFLSCDVMEPDGAQTHYVEPLIRLPGIGTRYEHPGIPANASRRQFGLPNDAVLLLCPQSLFKIHPDNDALFAEILAQNTAALLVLFAGRHPAITDQFMRRLARTLDRHGIAIRERTRVLPAVGHDDYLRINLVCDAMVDTMHWSGGNTSLDALACGLPVVTLPGTFMRGRQSAGMLSLLGVPELIARDRADYIALASRLIAEPAWRRSLADRIRAAQGRLFDVGDANARLQQLLQADDIRAV
jgi:predicted O-linked N-acetylglucosamine transferase (SPINDLY family)